jgi:hypothetical protein
MYNQSLLPIDVSNIVEVIVKRVFGFNNTKENIWINFVFKNLNL